MGWGERRGTRAGRWAAALVVGSCLLLAPDASADEQLDAVYAELDVQRELPRVEVPSRRPTRFDPPASDGSSSRPGRTADSPPGGSESDSTGGTGGSWGGGGSGGGAGGGTAPPVPGGTPAPGLGSGAAAGGLAVLGWVLLGAVVLLVLYLIWQAVRGSRVEEEAKPSSRPETIPDAGAEGAPVRLAPEADACRAEAERLRAAGDAIGAVHVLLLGGFQWVTGRTPGQLVDAHTSRELYSALELEGARARDLERLVGLTELGVFADRPPTESELDEGFDAYDRLRGARA